MKRIFIAVDISDRARSAAAAYIETLRGEFRQVRVGWERAEKLHLTMKFLGACETRQLQELENIAARIAAEIPRFTIRIADTGVFPNARSPRVLMRVRLPGPPSCRIRMPGRLRIDSATEYSARSVNC